ncbi:hypothetical protein HY490_04425 [Candidatus Woesearchaeota archaeon]|nr:hypothetical protein [Candidatus Woesearchaeota archaeon]
MQKGLAFLTVIILLSASVVAFGLADITGWVVSWWREPTPPVIEHAYLYPIKVRPGDQLLLTAKVNDQVGVKSVMAEVEHENGNDTVPLILVVGRDKQGTWQAPWNVHDTLDQKWYNVTITATNTYGLTTTIILEYQDPTVSHIADQVRPGTFTEGQYIFPSTSTVGVGMTPAQKLHVNGSLNVTGNISVQGNISIGTGTVTISSSDITCANCVGSADVKSGEVQLRVSSSCSGSQGIQSIGSSGTVSCGTFSGVGGEVLVLHHPSGSGSVNCPSSYTTVMTGRSYIGYGDNNPGTDGDMTCVKTAFTKVGSSDGSDITAGYISSSTTCKVCIRDDAPVGSVLELHMGDSTTFTSACSATGVTLPSSTTWSAQFSSAGKSYAGTGVGITSGGTGGHLTCIAATYSTSVSSSGGSFGGGSSQDDAMFADSTSGTTLTATNCNICIRTA